MKISIAAQSGLSERNKLSIGKALAGTGLRERLHLGFHRRTQFGWNRIETAHRATTQHAVACYATRAAQYRNGDAINWISVNAIWGILSSLTLNQSEER
jgi:hypothetical protein